MARVATKTKPEAPKKERSPAQLANDQRLRDAKNHPVQLRKMTESGDHPVAKQPDRVFTKDNELTPLQIVAPEGKSKRWMEDMAFANEMVKVRIHPSTDKLAHPFPEVIVNGRRQHFVPGEEQIVRRCYIERLARMKLTAYGSVKTKDVDGEDVYRYPANTAPVHGFTVIGDTPKGEQWLKAILAEPG